MLSTNRKYIYNILFDSNFKTDSTLLADDALK